MGQRSRPMPGNITASPNSNDSGPYPADGRGIVGGWEEKCYLENTGDPDTSGQRTQLRGVIPTAWNKLVVTSTGANNITVESGAAWCHGTEFIFDDLSVPAPPLTFTVASVAIAGQTRIDRVVVVQNNEINAYNTNLAFPTVLTDYDTTGATAIGPYTTRIAILTGTPSATPPGPSLPALVWTDNQWMVEIARYVIDDAGVITLTDMREFAQIEHIVGMVASGANTDKDALIIGNEVDDTGVASAGFGVAIRAKLDDAGGTLQDAGRLVFAWKTATAGAEVSSIKFYTQYINDDVVSGVIVAPGTASVDGNARGVGAVDFQGDRANATEVASGAQSVISGGNDNTASGQYSAVGGGTDNVASGQQSTVAGGSNCTATQTGSTVAGGSNNDATGGSAAIAGGENNDASGQRSFVGAGNANAASGQSSVICGGEENNATEIYTSIPGGYRATAALYGQVASASGYFAADGDAQGTIQMIARATTAGGGAATTLYLDGVGASQRITIPASSAWTYDILIVAMRQNNAGAPYSSRAYGVIYRDNAGNTTLASTSTVITENVPAGTSATVTADDATESLQIQFTDDGANVYRAVATIRLAEVSYP